MNRLHIVARTALTVLLLLTAHAQTNTGTIRGLVNDTSGGAIPGAHVQAVNADTGVAYKTDATEAGLYSLGNLPIGSYTLTVEHPGLRPYIQRAIAISTGQTLEIDVRLQVGEVTQAVTVAAQAPQLESDTSSVGQLIDSRSVADLPLGDRRTMNVIQLTGAAVFNGYDGGQKPNFSLAGGRAQSQMFWIDGGSGQNVRLGIGQVDVDPPVELVQELKVLSNNYSAEYGGSAGGVIIQTTKSGSNRYHGSLYEYIRNDALDAPGFFAPVQNGSKVKPELRYNVFGGTVGGRIKKDKTFFFLAYEGQQRRTGSTTTLTVPSLRERQGDFSQTFTAAGALVPIYDYTTNTPNAAGQVVRTLFPGNIIPTSRLDPVALKVISYYPLPNRPPDNLTGANNFRANGVTGLEHNFYSIKIDHNLSDRHRLTGRYLYNEDNSSIRSIYPDPGADPTTFADAHQRYGYFNWITTISPAVVNDFRVNYGNRIFHQVTGGVGGNYPEKLGLTGIPPNAFPQFTVTGYSALGSNAQERQQYPIESHQLVDNISFVRGRHAMKAGFEVRRSRNHELNFPTASGAFSFGTRATGLPSNATGGNGIASLLLGFWSSFTQQQTAELDRRMWYLAGFVQDDWTVSRSLTLNFGLRWEVDTPLKDANNRINSFDPRQINPVSGTPGVVKFLGVNGTPDTPYDIDLNNFAPRFGFAWKAFGHESTVVRGGYGIFYTHPFDGSVANALALGFSQSLSLSSPDNDVTGQFFLRDGLPRVNANTQTLDDTYGAVPVGATTNTSVSFLERNRRTGYAHQFNLGIQHQLPGGFVFEVVGLGNLGRKLPSANLNINQIDPSILGPQHQSQRDRPFPQFTQVTIQAPSLGTTNYYAGMLRAQKRFARGFNLVSTYTYSKFLENTNDIGTNAGADAGPYQDFYNRRGGYGPSTNDIRHRFTFSSVYELPFGKGKPYLAHGAAGAIVGNWLLGNVTTLQSGAPFTVAAQTNTTNSFSAGSLLPNVLRDPNLPADERSVSRWFDTAAFVQPPAYQFGNEGRNILRAAGIANFDFSLARNFSLGEQRRLQFRGEVFNAFNHTNLGIPGRTFGAAGFGIITNTATPARQIQGGLRLSF